MLLKLYNYLKFNLIKLNYYGINLAKNGDKEKEILTILKLISSCSNAKRRKVGALILDDRDRIVGLGVNRMKNPFESLERQVDVFLESKPTVIHAEIDAIKSLPKNGYNFKLFITDSPCVNCANSILKNGRINEIYYIQEYRLADGIDVIKNSNLKIKKMKVSYNEN